MAHYELYDDEGASTNEACPRCGDTFLADHGDRTHCGKCGYTQWA